MTSMSRHIRTLEYTFHDEYVSSCTKSMEIGCYWIKNQPYVVLCVFSVFFSLADRIWNI